MSKHTPGPWHIGGDPSQRWVEGPDANENVICDIVPRCAVMTPEDEANAEFICRAVNCHADLLAACRLALERIESDIETDKRKTVDGNALRAAIAKAQGEPT